jgi:hypothetical protein
MSTKPDEHLKELVTIRKLLVLALLRSGMTQSQVGAALGVHRTQIGRMFPAGAFDDPAKKKANKRSGASEKVDG